MNIFNSKRKIKNIRLTQHHQIKYYGWWFIISLALICVLSISLFFLFEEHWQGILFQNPERGLEHLLQRSRFITSLVFISLVLIICVTILGIITAHRVAGPFIALMNAFHEVKNGNLDCRITLRKEDDLSDVQKAFNEMMDSLQKR